MRHQLPVARLLHPNMNDAQVRFAGRPLGERLYMHHTEDQSGVAIHLAIQLFVLEEGVLLVAALQRVYVGGFVICVAAGMRVEQIGGKQLVQSGGVACGKRLAVLALSLLDGIGTGGTGERDGGYKKDGGTDHFPLSISRMARYQTGMQTTLPRFQSERSSRFTESVIREMSRLAIRHNAVNLAQGFPDFGAPAEIKEAARAAIDGDFNQYSITWGAKVLRDAIAAKYRRTYGFEVDPEREITVVCGATEGMVASLLATVDVGDEVIVFEPYYENYDPDIKLCGAVRKTVRLHAPDWNFDEQELRRAFSSRTKAIIINTPNNPTGKVFTRVELELIGKLCEEFDALAITDEIYEHITYDGRLHIPMITIPGLRDRTILVNSMSKTFSVTGWRVGWVIASPALTDSIRKVHDFLTVGAATPLQQASAMALAMPDSYFAGLSAEYKARKDRLLPLLERAGFKCFAPAGAYYVMTDISGFGFADDFAFAHHLLEHVGVAGVPGSSFYSDSKDGAQRMRFCFCKKFETLEAAGERLAVLRSR